jgi:hypothetical protein
MNMNQLFEEFIAEFIRRELREFWQSRGWKASQVGHLPTVLLAVEVVWKRPACYSPACCD